MKGMWRHRDAFLRRRLDARSLALFEPDERIVATFDGVRRGYLLRNLSGSLLGIGVADVALGLWGPGSGSFGRATVGFVCLGIVIAIRLVLQHSAFDPLTVALTNRGVVVCRRDRLGRPRRVVERGPVVRPEVVSGGFVAIQVRLGDLTLWTHRGTRDLVAWAERPWTPAPYEAAAR